MIIRLSLILLGLFYLTTAQAETSKGLTVGEAFSLDTQELLYRETHCQSDDQLNRKVLYKNPDGESIALKSIDYRNGLATPSFKQKHFQTGEETEVVVNGNQVTLSFTDSESQQKKKSFEKHTYSDLPLVIDAGFDAYIREQWDKLVSGEDQRFQFPLVTRSALIELKVSSAECSFEADNTQCFRLEMSNWLYRMLADPIELGYSQDQKRLLRYRGLSNIEDANGNGLNVDIRYDYSNLPQQACTDDKALVLKSETTDHG